MLLKIWMLHRILTPCTVSASLFWMSFEGTNQPTNHMVTRKDKPVAPGMRGCVHVVRALVESFVTIRFLEVAAYSFLLCCNLKTLSTLDLPQDEIGRAGNGIACTFIAARSQWKNRFCHYLMSLSQWRIRHSSVFSTLPCGCDALYCFALQSFLHLRQVVMQIWASPFGQEHPHPHSLQSLSLPLDWQQVSPFWTALGGGWLQDAVISGVMGTASNETDAPSQHNLAGTSQI